MIDSRARVNLSVALAYAPYGIAWTFLPIHLASLGASYLLISIVYFVPAIFPPFWGFALDKLRRGKTIVLVSILVEALVFIILPILKSPLEIVLDLVAMGLFSASFSPVYASIATWTTSMYGRAIGGFWMFAMMGFGVATITGGIVFEFYGTKPLFILGAGYGLLALFAAWLTPREAFYSPVVKEPVGSSKVLNLLRQRRLLSLCLLSGLVLLSSSSFNVFFTIYLVRVLGGSRLIAGLAAAGTTGLGALAYRFLGPLNDTFGRRPVFLAGVFGYIVYFAALYAIKNPLFVALLWVIPIYPLIRSSAGALASDYTPASDRGKGLGLLEAAISIGGGIGPVVGGAIADLTGTLDLVVSFSLGTAILTFVLSALILERKTTEHFRRATAG